MRRLYHEKDTRLSPDFLDSHGTLLIACAFKLLFTTQLRIVIVQVILKFVDASVYIKYDHLHPGHLETNITFEEHR